MAKRSEPYTTIIVPDGSLLAFPPQPLTPKDLPLSSVTIPVWLEVIQGILSQDHLPRQDRWNAIKAPYYGGLAVLIHHHIKNTLIRLEKWNPGDILTRFPVSSDASKYSLQLTRLHRDYSQASYAAALELFPQKTGTNPGLPANERVIFQNLTAIHEELLLPNSSGTIEPVAHRIQSGFGTAMEHLMACSHQAPFLYREAYGQLPTSTELALLLRTTMTQHIGPLSRTHLAALIVYEAANLITGDNPEQARLLLTRSPHPSIAFAHTPARASSYTLQSLKAASLSPSSPRIGCPARLSYDSVSPIKSLFESIALQVISIYENSFGTAVSSSQ